MRGVRGDGIAHFRIATLWIIRIQHPDLSNDPFNYRSIERRGQAVKYPSVLKLHLTFGVFNVLRVRVDGEPLRALQEKGPPFPVPPSLFITSSFPLLTAPSHASSPPSI